MIIGYEMFKINLREHLRPRNIIIVMIYIICMAILYVRYFDSISNQFGVIVFVGLMALYPIAGVLTIGIFNVFSKNEVSGFDFSALYPHQDSGDKWNKLSDHQKESALAFLVDLKNKLKNDDGAEFPSLNNIITTLSTGKITDSDVFELEVTNFELHDEGVQY